MTPKEFHIALDIQCQKLNSNAYSNIKPEQKDWLLNESIIRFIKTRVNPRSNNKKQGFADTIKRYDDLEDLITPYTMPLYKNDDNTLFGIFPYNYFHYLSSRTNVAYDCNGLTNTTIVPVIQRYCIATLKDATTSLYDTFKIALDNGSGFVDILDVSTVPYLSTGIPTLDAKFIIINWVLEQWNKLNLGIVKWETYDDLYYPNSFIFVSNNIIDLTIRIHTDTTDNYSFINRTFNKYNYTISNVNLQKNRIEKTDNYDDLLSHCFGTTRFDSPLGKFENGRLIINHSQKFISNSLELQYIRFPRKIDINLNQGSELDPSTDDEIIGMTVQKIKAILDSKNYQNIINENLLTE